MNLKTGCRDLSWPPGGGASAGGGKRSVLLVSCAVQQGASSIKLQRDGSTSRATMPQFDTHAFLQNLAEELVLAYDGAAQATTPGLIGSAREDAVRKKLESILPGGVAVGTGCVFDREGNASGQMDVVLYESQFCPVFKVAEDVSYYPCESVIAVGSIKSTIGKKELGEIYRNVASVRRLKKFAKPAHGEEPAPGKIGVRTYLEKSTRLVRGDRETIQNSSSDAQIYAFGFGRSFGAKPERMMDHTMDLYAKIPAALRPNVVLTVDKQMLAPAAGRQMSYSALDSPGVTFLKPDNSLEYLLVSLFRIVQNGVTAPGYAFESYVVPPPMTRTHTVMPSD